MKKIKVSHEVPFCLLTKSREFNDYDYCLPHLMDENEEYRTFFLNSKNVARYIVMDNSLHELGKAYDTDRLLHWIDKLEPDEFIVPDVWENYTMSVRNAKEWASVKLPEGVTKVAVVQAKSLHEATLCTQMYKDLGYKKIAYSYGASYYNEICPHPNKDLGKAIGRYMVISQLIKDRILSDTDRVHLLGTAAPIEFGMYKDIKCIESIDTSNPVMAAIELKQYTDLGLFPKPKTNMNSCQDMKIKDTFFNPTMFYDILDHNIKMFREINGL